MKNFLKVLAGFVVLLIIAGVLLISRVNTESNKTALSDAVLAATGYELIIGGDLSLSLFPNLGLSLADVRLKNPAYPMELASTSSAVLSVDLASLLSDQIQVREISTEDFHANYYVDEDGNSIWSVDAESSVASSSSADSTAGSPSASSSNSSSGEQGATDITTLSVERLRIANASIDIQDLSQGARYQIDNLTLDSIDTNIDGRPFSIDLQFDYENNGMSAPVPLALRSEVRADINARTLRLNDLQFSVTPMLMSGDVSINGLGSALNYEGSLSAAPFDVLVLLESLGMREGQQAINFGVDADKLMSFDMQFNGSEEQASIPAFNVEFAGANIESNAQIRLASDLAPLNISYNVNAGALDLSPFFPEPTSDEASAPAVEPTPDEPSSPLNEAAQYQPETELPVDLINSMTLLGAISIESITASGMLFENVNIFTNVEDGLLDIEIPPISLLDGSLRGTVRLNSRSSTPELETSLTANNLNLVDLAPSISRFNTLTGFLQMESNYTASGSTVESMLETVSGNTAFSVNENSVDIGVIKQVFTAIAALSPTGEAIQQWPDVMRFGDMSGYVLLEQGLESKQDVKLRMDNFDITGSGQIDLEAQSFAYDMLFTVLGAPHPQTIPVNELYHNVSWPVDCSAAFAEEVNRYCRPDFTQVREIFTQIGSNALRNELQDTITDQVPDELQDAARGLLRSILN